MYRHDFAPLSQPEMSGRDIMRVRFMAGTFQAFLFQEFKNREQISPFCSQNGPKTLIHAAHGNIFNVFVPENVGLGTKTTHSFPTRLK